MNEERKKEYVSILKSMLSLILILGPTLYFGFMGKSAEMGVALAAGALSAAFLNLDKLQKFKGAGIEFELKKAVEEAYATMENVKAVSEPLFIASIKMMTEGQTVAGIQEKDQHEIVEMISKITDSDLTSGGVKRAVEGFHTFNLKYSYYSIIHYNEKIYPKVAEKLVGLLDEVELVFPSEKQVRTVLSELPHLTFELEEKIKDYAYYKENRYPRSRS